MFFSKKPARPRRAPTPFKSQLRVEQLETRLTPAATADSGLSTIATSGSGGVSSPAIAVDANGDYVVGWGSNNQDGSGWNVSVQRYSANGTPQGSTTRVNTTSTGDQLDPSVAMDSVGDFVVTWSSYNQDGSGWGVYAQRYSANGAAQGGEFRVNTTTVGDQMHARVAMDSTGNFVVVWQSYGQDGSGWGIYAQAFTSLGVRQCGEFQVNNTSAGDQEYPAIAMNGTGNFVVTWSSYGQDGSGWGVCARRYGTLGVPLGCEFSVNTTTMGDQMYSAVGIDTAGDFLVSWSSSNQGGYGCGTTWGICARRYNALGLAQGGEFLVSNNAVGNQQSCAVAVNGSGDFEITWSSVVGSSYGTFAQQFTAGGAALNSAVQIGCSSTSTMSALAITATGQTVLVTTESSYCASGIYGELGYLA